MRCSAHRCTPAQAFLLAAGLATSAGASLARLFAQHPRHARRGLGGLVAVLVVLAMVSSGRYILREYRTSAERSPPSNARNVVLIVWDTVRASSTSANGYPRETTPHLKRWAQSGVRYAMALAAAPWTFPSHACFFTGEWPYTLNMQHKDVLDAPGATLAEYFASRGYQTAGFAGNTNYCSYESGLDRGFAHYEDYPMSPRFLLGRTVIGAWILKSVVNPGDFHARKWIRLQSRDAREINDAFFNWLARRPPDRPFFAFLNDFDAHDPYLPPADYLGRFGVRRARSATSSSSRILLT